jgi:hypothetical protein
MLDKLPLKLLDHVLELLPPPSTFESARERTDALLACCLVSKRVYERSCMVLWENLRLGTDGQIFAMDRVVETAAGTDCRQRVKALVVGNSPRSDPSVEYPRISLPPALRLAELFPALQALALSNNNNCEVDLMRFAKASPSRSLPSQAAFTRELSNFTLQTSAPFTSPTSPFRHFRRK